MSGVEVVFCTDLTDVPGQDVSQEHRQHHMLMHEAKFDRSRERPHENGGKATPEEALETRKPYRSVRALGKVVPVEFGGGFPSTDRLMDQAPGPGSEKSWRAAGEAGTPE